MAMKVLRTQVPRPGVEPRLCQSETPELDSGGHDKPCAHDFKKFYEQTDFHNPLNLQINVSLKIMHRFT